MAYKVIRAFRDLDDNGYLYGVGDSYPRYGYQPTKERIQELSTTNNKLGKALIKKAGGPNGQERQGPSEARGQEGHEIEEEPKENFEEKEVKDGFPKHIGGGYYGLSNGEKVRGKAAAMKAEAVLKSGE